VLVLVGVLSDVLQSASTQIAAVGWVFADPRSEMTLVLHADTGDLTHAIAFPTIHHLNRQFGILSESASQTFQMLFPTDFAAADAILAKTYCPPSHPASIPFSLPFQPCIVAFVRL